MDRLRVSRAALALCLTAAAPPVFPLLPSPASDQAVFGRATAFLFPFLENIR